jgi:hypothetical protein
LLELLVNVVDAKLLERIILQGKNESSAKS